MKFEKAKPKFEPVTITLETEEELKDFRALITVGTNTFYSVSTASHLGRDLLNKTVTL